MGGFVDTAAPSWLGPQAVRTPDGSELFFNSFGDTVRVMPHSTPGDAWTLARDTAWRTFRATVIAASIDTLDGIPDSVKTASIQAFVGIVAVGHSYNAKRLRWSKHRGWLETLDFFVFPNDEIANANNVIGIVRDTATAIRLPWTRIAEGLEKVDLTRKYAAGNEWIISSRIGWSPFYYTSGVTTHDSVIAFQALSTTHGLATIYTTRYQWQNPTGQAWEPPTTTVFIQSVHVDTVYAMIPPTEFDSMLLPEVKTIHHLMNNGNGGFAPPETEGLISPIYTIAPFCAAGDFVVSRRRADDGHLDPNGSCWEHTVGPDYYARCQSILTGFGLAREHQEGSNGAPLRDYSVSYLKLATCTSGTKTDLAALAISRDAVRNSHALLLPNPASASTLLVNLARGYHAVRVRDALGRSSLHRDQSHRRPHSHHPPPLRPLLRRSIQLYRPHHPQTPGHPLKIFSRTLCAYQKFLHPVCYIW